MNTVKLTKMNGCGNDFVIIDLNEFDKVNMSMSDFAKKICNRNFGVGADGFIIPDINEKNADIGWFFYNSDGSTAQMCGNGMRCFAKYVTDNQLVKKNKFTVMTGAGLITPEILNDGTVKVNMSKPVWKDAEKIPFNSDKTINFNISAGGQNFKANAISMGNPHCVIFTDYDVHDMAKTFGRELEQHPLFPQKVNVEFANIVSKNEIDLCVYERGCGITLACGTGACATVVAAILNNLTECKVKVNLPGGSVIVDWSEFDKDNDCDIFLIGEANYNFYADYLL